MDVFMNHPYHNDIQKKFSKKKILSHQQAAVQRHIAYLKDQAVIVGAIMGICSLVLILVAWSPCSAPLVRTFPARITPSSP